MLIFLENYLNNKPLQRAIRFATLSTSASVHAHHRRKSTRALWKRRERRVLTRLSRVYLTIHQTCVGAKIYTDIGKKFGAGETSTDIG
jgi:hypothetical protein